MQIVKTKSKKVPIIITAITLIGLALGVYVIFFHTSNEFAGTAGVSKVNYGPPTKDEQAAGNTQKEESVKQQAQDKQTTPASTANIFITDASYYADDSVVEVRAYMTNIYEDGGTCTATFTQGSQTVTKTSSAFKDATTTQCGTIDIPRSEFPSAGTWSLTLTYASASATGQKTATVKL